MRLLITLKNSGVAIFLLTLCAVFCAGNGMVRAQGEESGGADMVTCSDTMVKVDAPSVKPEDLIRELGDKCGIKVVVFGEAFEDKTIGVKFQQQPIRRGIERILRIANMPNFVLHFDNNTRNPRIVELDIMGKKGGERQLTAGTRSGSKPSTPAPAAPQVKTPEKPAPPENRNARAPDFDPNGIISEKAQEDFMKVMDEMMKAQEMGEEPDPAEVLRIFKEVVPPEIREQIPPDVLKEIEEFEKNPQQIPGLPKR